MILFDFSSNSDLSDWSIVNDNVMGGLSSSTFTIDDNGNGIFKGMVSLENNGGFCSVRYSFEEVSVKGFEKIVIRLKGDGKEYQFRIKHKQSDYYSYIATFKTSDKWQTIELLLNEMYPSFRGRKLDQPNFDKNSIEEIALLIGNKKAESFKLEMDKVELK